MNWVQAFTSNPLATGVVTADGQLKHYFWGDYFAGIALAFKDAKSAGDAKKILGGKWKHGKKNRSVLVGFFKSKELDAVKEQLAMYGADPKKIDSVAKSIDYGEPFKVAIPVVAREQQSLPFMKRAR